MDEWVVMAAAAEGAMSIIIACFYCMEIDRYCIFTIFFCFFASLLVFSIIMCVRPRQSHAIETRIAEHVVCLLGLR